MMEPKYEITVAECSLCGETKEAAVFQMKWWVFTVTMAICQSCVSRILRSFQKGK